MTIAEQLKEAEEHMATGRWTEAGPLYARSLEMARTGSEKEWKEPHLRLWLALAQVEALVRAGDFASAFEILRASKEQLQPEMAVVGHPFFHLRVGTVLYEMAEPLERRRSGPGTPIDNFARALICAGVELFDGEPAAYLEATSRELRPPPPFASWSDSRGHYEGPEVRALRICPAELVTLRGLLKERGYASKPFGFLKKLFGN